MKQAELDKLIAYALRLHKDKEGVRCNVNQDYREKRQLTIITLSCIVDEE